MKKPKIVKISWIDSCGPDGWIDLNHLTKSPEKIESAGYLLEKNSKCVVISCSVGKHFCHAPLTIPTEAILSIDIL